MKMGKVLFTIWYAVDLDNQSQIDCAKEYIRDDLMDIDLHDHVDSYIKIEEDSSLKPEDIYDGILEQTGGILED